VERIWEESLYYDNDAEQNNSDNETDSNIMTILF
jgi:hypothetical protein